MYIYIYIHHLKSTIEFEIEKGKYIKKSCVTSNSSNEKVWNNVRR